MQIGETCKRRSVILWGTCCLIKFNQLRCFPIEIVTRMSFTRRDQNFSNKDYRASRKILNLQALWSSFFHKLFYHDFKFSIRREVEVETTFQFLYKIKKKKIRRKFQGKKYCADREVDVKYRIENRRNVNLVITFHVKSVRPSTLNTFAVDTTITLLETNKNPFRFLNTHGESLFSRVINRVTCKDARDRRDLSIRSKNLNKFVYRMLHLARVLFIASLILAKKIYITYYAITHIERK